MAAERDSTDVVKIATRASALAMAQSRQVGEMLSCAYELVSVSTRGDRTGGPLTEIGGKGLFTAELEEALRQGRVQVAVHSAKDLPAVMADDLIIAAVPPREDARDALVYSVDGWHGMLASRVPCEDTRLASKPCHPSPFASLPASARIGTSSLRRSVQVLAARPDAKILPLRGNVGTRVKKLRDGQYDAIILAMAGIKRLGLLAELSGMVQPLEIEDFVPAAGQGALAVQCLARDARTRTLLSAINDPESAAALAAERDVVRALGAGCRSSLGIHVRRQQGLWQGLAMVAAAGHGHANGLRRAQSSRSVAMPPAVPPGPIIRVAAQTASAAEAASQLIQQLQRQGARELLQS